MNPLVALRALFVAAAVVCAVVVIVSGVANGVALLGLIFLTVAALIQVPPPERRPRCPAVCDCPVDHAEAHLP